MNPTFSRDELDAMARPPAAQLAAAVAAGDRAAAAATFERLERGYRNFIRGFHAFRASIQAHVLTHHGLGALAALDDTAFTSLVAEATGAAAIEPWVREPGARRAMFCACLDADDRDGALAVFTELEEQLRAVHDLGVGQVAACLSHVYRTYGVDELEACLRACGDHTLLAWMPHDLQRPAATRVRQWAAMMLGNFATVRVDETDDEFVITQDPCGTCTRQLLAGCYAGPDGYAVVTERHPITWQRGGVPVYRTHVAVMHDLMPLERIGRRWPEITCPEGMGTGPCTVVLRKDGGAVNAS